MGKGGPVGAAPTSWVSLWAVGRLLSAASRSTSVTDGAVSGAGAVSAGPAQPQWGLQGVRLSALPTSTAPSPLCSAQHRGGLTAPLPQPQTPTRAPGPHWGHDVPSPNGLVSPIPIPCLPAPPRSPHMLRPYNAPLRAAGRPHALCAP